MSRLARAKLAEETLAICATGRYVAPGGRDVELATVIREAVASSRIYSPEDMVGREFVSSFATRIEITGESTIAAARRLAGDGAQRLACLNFASAKNPGGGFLSGSEAQEESLARASALHPCLLAAPAYYQTNRSCRTALYFDLAIWSRAVPFFRDDTGALLEEPFATSVITAPAPNAVAIAMNEPQRLAEVEATFRRRAQLVCS